MDKPQSRLAHVLDLSARLWQAASGPGYRARPDFWPSREIQEVTGLSIVPGRIIANHYAFGSAGQFVSQCEGIIAEVARHLGLECSDEEWLRANHYLSDLFREFYSGQRSGRSIPQETPALLAVIPVYVTERYVLKRMMSLVVEDDVRRVDAFPAIGGNRLVFGNDREYPPLHLDLRRVELHRPPDRGARDLCLMLRERRRGFRTRSGGELIKEFTWGLSFACPDDKPLLYEGGYYPAFDAGPIRVADFQGTTAFVRTAVLKLFRLHVVGSSPYECDVNHINISFKPQSGLTMDFHTVCRPFWQAVHHYLDLVSVLDERLPTLPWRPQS